MFSLKQIASILLVIFIISDLSSANMRLCGKSLTQFLDMVCVNGFNSKELRAKKFDPSIDLNENGLENDIQDSAFGSLFMDKLFDDRNSLMAKTRRRRHEGVADECCSKPCTMPELLSYCR